MKSEHEVLEYLKNGTLVGLLPVPHPILIRKYQTSDSTELWFHTYIWGVIYVRYVVPVLAVVPYLHMGSHICQVCSTSTGCGSILTYGES